MMVKRKMADLAINLPDVVNIACIFLQRRYLRSGIISDTLMSSLKVKDK